MSDAFRNYQKIRDRELKGFEGNESNFGQNTNHAVATRGPNAGQRAVGRYAFMPGTLAEIEKKTNDPRLEDLKGMSKDELALALKKDPAIERAFAENYYDEVYAKHPNDPDARAASWLMGPNRSDAATHALIERLPRLQKYVDDFHKHEDTDRMPAAVPGALRFRKIDDIVNPKETAPKTPKLGQSDRTLEQEFDSKSPQDTDLDLATDVPQDNVQDELASYENEVYANRDQDLGLEAEPRQGALLPTDFGSFADEDEEEDEDKRV